MNHAKGETMREMRQMWVEADEVWGEYLQPGNVTTLRFDSSRFALRRWDGSEPVPAGTVVRVVETRGYGSLIVTECEDADEVRQLIEDVRPTVAELGDDALQELVDRFPATTA